MLHDKSLYFYPLSIEDELAFEKERAKKRASGKKVHLSEEEITAITLKKLHEKAKHLPPVEIEQIEIDMPYEEFVEKQTEYLRNRNWESLAELMHMPLTPDTIRDFEEMKNFCCLYW